MRVRLRVSVRRHERVWVRVRVRVRVRVCLRVRLDLRMRLRVCTCVRACVRARVCMRVRACVRAGAHSPLPALENIIACLRCLLRYCPLTMRLAIPHGSAGPGSPARILSLDEKL